VNHERRSEVRVRRELRRRALEQPVLVAAFDVVAPDHVGDVVPVELVAQPPSGEDGVDAPARQQRLHRLGAQGGRAAHPARVLFGVVVDELAVEGLDVVEGPLRAELDGARQPLLVVDRVADAGDPVVEERRVTDVVGAQEGIDRDAAPDVLPEVLDGVRRRHDIFG